MVHDQHSSISSIPSTFHCFLQLPPEIREIVWKLCLPSRTREVDEILWPYDTWLNANYAECRRKGWRTPHRCDLESTSKVNKCPPLIASVCQESRKIAWKASCYHDPLDANKHLCLKWSGHGHFDVARDSPHTFDVENRYDRPLGSNNRRLDIVLDDMSDGKEDGGSFMFEPILHWRQYEVYRGYDPEGGVDYSSSESEITLPNEDTSEVQETRASDSISLPNPAAGDASPASSRAYVQVEQDIPARQSKWLVIMYVIIVHAPYDSDIRTTGLFGLLGDAPVQVVDTNDTIRARALYDLAERCERAAKVLSVEQDFTRHPQEVVKQRLQDALCDNRCPEALFDRLRPAIMFRWCTQMCNHI